MLPSSTRTQVPPFFANWLFGSQETGSPCMANITNRNLFIPWVKIIITGRRITGMANNISLQGIGRWHICTGELAKDCTKSHTALIKLHTASTKLHIASTKLHIACKKLHIACTQFEPRCEHMLPLVGGKEHSQVAYLLERLSTVILTISPIGSASANCFR